MYRKTVLDNGVRIVTSPCRDVQSLALGIWIRTGARGEEAAQGGISHFLEHMVLKGTRHYACSEIKESIEGVGGSFNGFTAEELTCYYVKIPAAYFDLALDILSEMVLYPTLAQDEIQKERTVVLEEIKMYRDQPQSHVYELIDELLWPDQPLGRSILGSAESVGSLGRADLKAYRDARYSAANIVVSAAGRFSHDTVVRKAAKRFSALNAARPNRFPAALVTQEKPRLRILHKQTEQTHLVFGFHSLRRQHELRYALAVLNVILGANSSSRLYNEVREKKGLAYEIGTGAKRLEDTGAFFVHAGVDNEKVKATVRLVLDQVAQVCNTLVGREEFDRAKRFFLGQLMLALEDTMDQMLWIGESTASINTVYSLAQIIRGVRQVSRQQVRDVARLVFQPRGLNLALIGPLEGKDEELAQQLYIP